MASFEASAAEALDRPGHSQRGKPFRQEQQAERRWPRRGRMYVFSRPLIKTHPYATTRAERYAYDEGRRLAALTEWLRLRESFRWRRASNVSSRAPTKGEGILDSGARKRFGKGKEAGEEKRKFSWLGGSHPIPARHSYRAWLSRWSGHRITDTKEKRPFHS